MLIAVGVENVVLFTPLPFGYARIMTEKYSIRPARAPDHDTLLKLLPQLADFEVPEKRNPKHLWESDAQLLQKLFDGDTQGVHCHVVIDPEDNVLGMTLVTMRDELLSHAPSAHLEAIVVSPKTRGMGLGRQLLAHAEHIAKQNGAESISLHVFSNNQRARALYQAEGFDSELIRAIKWLE